MVEEKPSAFCPACGEATSHTPIDEWSMRCTKCGHAESVIVPQ